MVNLIVKDYSKNLVIKKLEPYTIGGMMLIVLFVKILTVFVIQKFMLKNRLFHSLLQFF
jgi:hypothetical protein